MSPVTSSWKSQKILVIAKAYPEISSRNGEIVCTAGVTEKGEWRRIFPVPFRDLAPKSKFEKWQWISVLAAKHSDPRPESYRIQPDSIKVLNKLDSAKHLDLRKRFIKPGVFRSLHDIENKKLTLGAFRPKDVKGLIIARNNKVRTPKQTAVILQPSLFTKDKSILKEKTLDFTYIFTCDDESCPKDHKLRMIDWEIYGTYFNFLRQYSSEEQAIKALKDKWLNYFFEKRHTYFIAGTHRRFKTWMLIGYFSLGLHDSLERYQKSFF